MGLQHLRRVFTAQLHVYVLSFVGGMDEADGYVGLSFPRIVRDIGLPPSSPSNLTYVADIPLDGRRCSTFTLPRSSTILCARMEW